MEEEEEALKADSGMKFTNGNLLAFQVSGSLPLTEFRDHRANKPPHHQDSKQRVTVIVGTTQLLHSGFSHCTAFHAFTARLLRARRGAAARAPPLLARRPLIATRQGTRGLFARVYKQQ